MYHGVLYDLDGTILDTTELILGSFRHASRKVLGEEISADKVMPFFGRPLVDILTELWPDKVDAMRAAYNEYSLENHDRLVKAFPDVAETMADIQSHGIRQAIVTSKRRRLTQRGLEKCGLAPYITTVIAYEDTTEHKPGPQPIREAFSRLAFSPEAVVMVGDSLHDLEAARNAGVCFAGVSWSVTPVQSFREAGARWVLDSMKELTAICLG